MARPCKSWVKGATLGLAYHCVFCELANLPLVKAWVSAQYQVKVRPRYVVRNHPTSGARPGGYFMTGGSSPARFNIFGFRHPWKRRCGISDATELHQGI